jgi:mono/diheme cytochrome c family protein
LKNYARQTALLALLCAAALTGTAAAEGDAGRGQYLAQAGGCMACHTEDKKDAVPYSGGRPLKTPFGIFYGPNITPDPQAGIGNWTEADFVRAMRHGERPDGANYFPAFPYPSFTRISDADLRDLWAYLRSLAPSQRASREHALNFPFGWRVLVAGWKWLYFTPGDGAAAPPSAASAQRGAYLVQALGHCGECHTPRNFLGGPKPARTLAGGKGPNDKRMPNLTPTRLKKWTDAELKEFLLSGATPDGDAADEMMDEVIRNTTSRLTPTDLAAVIAYLRSLPPLDDEPR